MKRRALWRVCMLCFFLVILCTAAGLAASAEPAAPTLTLTLNGKDSEALTYGDTLTLAAALEGAAAPTGDVVFYMDGDEIGRAAPDADGIAHLTVTGKPVVPGSYAMSAIFEGDERNSVAVSPEAALTVSKKMLTAPEIQVEDKEFDGNNGATVHVIGTPGGVLKGDEVSVSVASALFAGSAVGENITVTVVLTLDGADRGLYRISSTWTGSADITDHVAPFSDILVSGASVVSEDSAAALFYRGSVTLTFLFEDLQSGIRSYAYQVVPIGTLPSEGGYLPLPEGDTVTWSTRGGVVIYLRVQDHSGNESVVHTKGLVVFEDATALDSAITYRFYSGTVAAARVSLNGNTVASVTVDGTVLAAADFTVDAEGVILLAPAFLETLTAGGHTVTVQYLAAGYPFVEGEMPAPTSFTLTMERKTPALSDFICTLPQNPVYDGKAHAAQLSSAAGMGAFTIWYLGPDGVPVTTPPQNAGTYTVRVSVTEGDKFTAGELELGSFTVAKAPVGVPTGVAASDCTTLANHDGKLTGLTPGMEYRPAGSAVWLPVTGEALTGLVPGEYELRMAEDENHLPGEVLSLSVARYAGVAEPTPGVVFDAATGSLSGLRAGDLYRIDGGAWTALDESAAAGFDRPMTVELYHPGDGVCTLDSAIQRLVITRPAAPSPTAEAETLFARCDGKITGVNAGMEYRYRGETFFRPVTGDVIGDLAPGEYEVRVRAAGTALAGESAFVTVAAAPEFVEREIAGEHLSISGSMTADATLTVTVLPTDESAESLLLSQIDLRTTEVLAHLLADFAGRTESTATVRVFLGSEYENGHEVTLYVAENGEVTKRLLTVEGGAVTFEASGSVQVLITEPMVTPHGQGSHAWIVLLVVFVAIAVGLCVFMEIRTHKKART